MQDATPQLYPSVVSNLFATGLHQVVFRTVGASARGTMSVDGADFVDNASVNAMVDRTKNLGSLGTLVGERFSLDFFRAVCRHPSNPLKLAGFENYEPTYEDCAVVAHGSLDGERCVWDQLIAPNLTRLGLSVDPGVVPPTPGRPDGGVLEQPTPIGTAADPAMALVFQLQESLRFMKDWKTEFGVPLRATSYWETAVAPLLANPLTSS